MPNPACRDGLPDGALLLASHVQSSGDILVDQAGNFILYETRINPVAANYIRRNGLDHESGRLEFANAGQPVDFPMGHGPNTRVSNTGSFAKGVIKTASASDSADAVVADAAVDARKNSVMGAQLLKFAWMGMLLLMVSPPALM